MGLFTVLLIQSFTNNLCKKGDVRMAVLMVLSHQSCVNIYLCEHHSLSETGTKLGLQIMFNVVRLPLTHTGLIGFLSTTIS